MTAAPPRDFRFAADRMLGRLARWLRLLGVDVAAGAHLGGRGLLRLARREGRIVLTRDGRVVRAASGHPVFFVESDRLREQLPAVVRTFGLAPLAPAGADFLGRCAECNEPLERVDPEAVRERVPAYVCATQRDFRRCPSCPRIYWAATHVERIRSELRKMGLL